MRSVLTILLFLIVLGAVLLYTTKRSRREGRIDSAHGDQAYGRGWENGGGTGGGWRWGWFGFVPYPSYTYEVVEESEEIQEVPVDQPCSTDLDCTTGHCSMFGICTNGLSL